jgi:eukaryotic-like serine/threonine-protein kinase
MIELIGNQLGDYEILQWLGDGAHVHAFLAHKVGSEGKVVIKVLKASLAHTEQFLTRFEQEAQAAMALDHPNIVKILDYCEDGETLFLVEEFLPGGSLRDIFERKPGPLPLDRVARTLDDIGSVLDYAHQRGIVHRDLKPENVLYDADGSAHLTDLGITKSLDPNEIRSRSDIEFGNPNYLSPEAWQGKPADPRTDIYALGIIAFQMLTGQLPFNTAFTSSVVYLHLMHLTSKPKSLRSLRPELSPAVEAVIAKAIEKDPANRFETAGELAAAFRAALKG